MVGRFGDASNATLLVHLGEGDPPPVAGLADLGPNRWGVFKPRAGEAPLWDFPEGTLYRREVAAFLVDRALGWAMVPPTVVREHEQIGIGSLQLFVPHDPDRHFLAEMQDDPTPVVLRQYERMVVFDAIVENADRKAGHVLLDDHDRAWLVDHGVCFHPHPHLRTVAWHLAGQQVCEEDRRDVQRLAGLLAPGSELDRRLRGLLDEVERAALRERVGRVAAPGSTHPLPPAERAMPWPPV